MCQSLFFKKVAGLSLQFYKKETLVHVFSCEFCKISSKPFLQNPFGWLLLEYLVRDCISDSVMTHLFLSKLFQQE